MTVLFIITNHPYSCGDTVYNALRLADTLINEGSNVRIFLMGDAVDLARDICKKPENYDVDLVEMLKGLISRNVKVKVCGSCMSRCGIHKNVPYYDGAEKSTMPELAKWVIDSDKVLNF